MVAITAHDLDAISRRLGRVPAARIVDVPVRDAAGLPAVITCYPLTAGRSPHAPPRPFPTLYWLVDPSVCRGIDRLEQAGGIAEVRRWLHADPRAAGVVADQARRYADRRLAMLSSDDRRALPLSPRGTRGPTGLLAVLCDSGVGGGVDPLQPKCLHMHAAHAMATGDDVIGARVLGRLDPIAGARPDKNGDKP